MTTVNKVCSQCQGKKVFHSLVKDEKGEIQHRMIDCDKCNEQVKNGQD